MDARTLDRRLLIGGAMCVVFLFLFAFYKCSMSSGPTVYAGDRLEMRPCYACQGGGCQFCDGKGKREYLLPGPNHPTRIMGEVFDLAIRGRMDLDMPRRVGPNIAQPGAIEGAAV